jgi:predicted Zn-dependent protease
MHRTSCRLFLFPLLVAAAAGPLACATSGINKGDLSLISIKEEWQLGQQLSTDIAKQKRILDTPEINRYVTRMGEDIIAQAKGDTPVADQPWHFYVIDDDTVNAFNIPGGYVYLQSGLVAKADTYAELMGVMAHECSHGLARHGVENLTKQYGIVMVASLVLGKNPAVYQEVLASVLANGAVSKFSRDAEAEADRLGARYMYDAGVNPEGMVNFFRVLLELRQSRPSSIEQFFASHPLTEDRIKDVQNEVDGFAPKSLTTHDPGFAAFKEAVARAAAGS